MSSLDHNLVCANSLGDSFAAPASLGWGRDDEGYGGEDNWPTVIAGGPRAVGCADSDGDGICDDVDTGQPADSGFSSDSGLPGEMVPLSAAGCGCGSAPGVGGGSGLALGVVVALLRRRRSPR